MIDVGYLYPRAAMYTLLPAEIGTHYKEGHRYFYWAPRTIIQPDEWEALVLESNVKLLYLDYADYEFVADYGHFFPTGVKTDMLYRILNDNGNMTFIPFR